MDSKPLLLKLDEFEAVAIDFIVKAVVWLTPLFTAILLYYALIDTLGLHPVAAGIGAAVIELAGLGFMHSMMSYFYQWKGEQPARVNFFITAACVAGYVLTAFTIALVVKLPGDWATYGRVAVPPLAVILSMQSALVGSVRASTYKAKLLSSPRKPTRKRKKTASGPVNKPPGEQTEAERLANLNRANNARQPTQADYNRAAQLKSDGLTWSQVASELERSESTVKRWAALAEPEPQPVYVNGDGGQ